MAIYSGGFLLRDDARRLEIIARDHLSGVLEDGEEVVVECGHMTHTFCMKDEMKQMKVAQWLQKMPETYDVEFEAIAYRRWEGHFISAFVPRATPDLDISSNDHPHVTAIRLKKTSPFLSNDMLAAEDREMVRFDRPIRVTLHRGAVIMKPKK
jgi:metal-sulfur cluster biosynthetic enzyme